MLPVKEKVVQQVVTGDTELLLSLPVWVETSISRLMSLRTLYWDDILPSWLSCPDLCFAGWRLRRVCQRRARTAAAPWTGTRRTRWRWTTAAQCPVTRPPSKGTSHKVKLTRYVDFLGTIRISWSCYLFFIPNFLDRFEIRSLPTSEVSFSYYVLQLKRQCFYFISLHHLNILFYLY